ncbi:unnamed protein product, partial [Mesorhabditis spiculigera]
MRKLGMHVENGLICRELPLAGHSVVQEQPEEEQRLRLILPHLSLACSCLAYVIVVSSILLHFEKPAEVVLKASAQREFAVEVLRLEEILHRNFSSEMARQLAIFERLDHLTELHFYWYEQRYSPDEQWNFPNALFFCVSMLTTIGYGTIAPLTRAGRLLSIGASLLGVPLMLITVTDIGMFLAEACKLLSHKYTYGHSCPSVLPGTAIFLILIGYIFLGTGLMSQCDGGHNMIDSFYWSFITMTSIGFGDIVPESRMAMLGCGLYMVIGISITTMCIDQSVAYHIHRIHFFGRRMASNISDIVGHARFLRRRPGMILDQMDGGLLEHLRALALADRPFKQKQSATSGLGAYDPEEADCFRWIDQSRGISVVTRKGTVIKSFRAHRPPIDYL